MALDSITAARICRTRVSASFLNWTSLITLSPAMGP